MAKPVIILNEALHCDSIIVTNYKVFQKVFLLEKMRNITNEILDSNNVIEQNNMLRVITVKLMLIF